MANLSSVESSKPHSPQKSYLIGELKDAKLTIAQKDEVINKWRQGSKDWRWIMKICIKTERKDLIIIIGILHGRLNVLIDIMKKRNRGGTTTMKKGAKMWLSLIYLM